MWAPPSAGSGSRGGPAATTFDPEPWVSFVDIIGARLAPAHRAPSEMLPRRAGMLGVDRSVLTGIGCREPPARRPGVASVWGLLSSSNSHRAGPLCSRRHRHTHGLVLRPVWRHPILGLSEVQPAPALGALFEARRGPSSYTACLFRPHVCRMVDIWLWRFLQVDEPFYSPYIAPQDLMPAGCVTFTAPFRPSRRSPMTSWNVGHGSLSDAGRRRDPCSPETPAVDRSRSISGPFALVWHVLQSWP